MRAFGLLIAVFGLLSATPALAQTAGQQEIVLPTPQGACEIETADLQDEDFTKLKAGLPNAEFNVLVDCQQVERVRQQRHFMKIPNAVVYATLNQPVDQSASKAALAQAICDKFMKDQQLLAATGTRDDKLNALIAAARADARKPVQVESDRSARACYLARVAPAKATPGSFELGVLAYSFAKGYPILIFVAAET